MTPFYTFTTILLLIFLKLNAQTTDIITNINQPTSVFVNGNDIYFGSYTNSLYKAYINSPQNQSTIIFTNGIYRTFLYGNDLYVSETYAGRISKIDITDNTPSPIEIITNLDRPVGIVIQNDILYFAESGNTNSISKININDSNPVKTIISNNFVDPTGINLIGNDLYVAEFLGNKISKIDITQTSPLPINVVFLNNPTEIIVNGNNLLVSEFSGNRVIQIDITNSTPVITNLVTNITNPTGLFLNGNELYISVYGENKIVRFLVPALGSQDFNNTNVKIKLFPNPSSKYIQIQGLTKTENYVIYDVQGAKINDGVISNNDKIDLQNLKNGICFLKFDNESSIKFVKN